MKRLICLLVPILLLACNEKIIENNAVTEVEKFIEMLKLDQSDQLEAPDFDERHIEELMTYRSEERAISKFPRNLLSSFYMENVNLGMYVLWTVESIRMETIESADFYLYASLNPRVARRSTGEVVNQEAYLSIVADAYSSWWNSGLPLSEKLQIDPLEDHDLFWN